MRACVDGATFDLANGAPGSVMSYSLDLGTFLKVSPTNLSGSGFVGHLGLQLRHRGYIEIGSKSISCAT